jgi:hypothetical protein
VAFDVVDVPDAVFKYVVALVVGLVILAGVWLALILL